MDYNIKTILTTDNFLGYFMTKKEHKPDDFKLSEIFPTRRVSGLDYSYIKGRNGLVSTLSPSTYDTESIVRDRGGFDYAKGELALFKNKMTVKAKQKQELFNFLHFENKDAVNNIVGYIFDDESRLLDSAMMTQEYLRARALFDGKIAMSYDGGTVDVNYGYDTPKDNTGQLVDWRLDSKANSFTLGTDDKWDDVNANILEMIINWADDADDRSDVRPDTMWMNINTLRVMQKNTVIRAQLDLYKRNKLSTQVLIAFIKEVTGVTIKIYNKKLQTTIGGVAKTVDLIEDGRIVLLPSNKTLGNLMVGTSPAEFDKADTSNISDVTVTGEGIAITKWTENDPIQLFTSVQMICLPSFPEIGYSTAVKVYEKKSV